MEKIIRNSLISYFIIGLYFTGVAFTKHFKDYNKKSNVNENDQFELSETDYHRCDVHISRRLLILFISIFIPVFFITLFGGYCKIKAYRKRLGMNYIQNDTFNLKSRNILM